MKSDIKVESKGGWKGERKSWLKVVKRNEK